jgi:3-deoxy-D-manno-octulosonate 8-phosphate phosphatase (KDO 8-P phosphatase)
VANATQGARRAVDLRARRVRVVVVDVDGVLTDGRVVVDGRGREARSFHATDRTAIGLLARAGIPVVGLVAGPRRGMPAFGRWLRLAAVLEGSGRGLESVGRWCRRRRIPLEAVAYLGHDVLELPLLAAAGLGIAVAGGPSHARRAAHWVTANAQGDAVVREVAERILRAQGKWASTMGETWRRWD